MIEVPVRRLALACALAVLALAAAASSAQAAITASTISSPAANSYFFENADAPSSTVFTASGTTTGSGNIDIKCYDGINHIYTLVAGVTPTGNTFAVPITTTDFPSLTGTTCVLRAVAAGDTTAYPPSATPPFSGPVIAVTQRSTSSNSGLIYDFNYYLNGFSGAMQFDSAGSCGLDYGNLFAPGTLVASRGSFDCLGALFDTYTSGASTPVGPEIIVDSAHALDASQALETLPGYQGITLTESFSAGNLTIHDNEPLMLCVPNCSSPTSFTSSGVELDRTWQTTADGRIALQTDVFRSADGHQHSISVLEDDEIATFPPGVAMNFPGSSGFQDYSNTATVSLPSGPGTIYFKTDSATADTGDAVHPQGAILYSSATTGPVAFTRSDENSSGQLPEWVMPYTRTVPAGGAAVLRFAYVQAYALSDVQALAQTALASFAPAVSIAAPGSGATVTSSPVTVSGTVTDAAGVKSVTVNGVAATLGAGGTFTAPVALTLGANTITAVATDNDGITGQQQISLTYKAPPAVTTGAASHITGSGAKIAGTVNPESQASTFEVQYGTTTAYPSHTSAASAGAGSAAVVVSSTLKSLKAKTTYHYRLIATNASGTSYGTDATFKTGKPSPTGLGAKAHPGTATSFPYHYTIKGKLSLPKGVTAKQACSGTITITVKHGKKTIDTTQATIGKKCTWKASVTLKNHSKVPGHGKLRITPSFGGNQALAGLTAKPLTVHYG